jgi:hypothetical protein
MLAFVQQTQCCARLKLMAILIEQSPVPETGVFEVNIHQSFVLNVTAEAARRTVHFC